MALSPVVQCHERQRGEHVRGQHKAGHVDAGGGQGIPQKASVHVVPHLADEGGALAQTGGGRQHIGRSAAGVLLKKPHAGIGQAAICEVDQQLAQRRDIEPGGHDRASGYSLHSRR